ncbi:hypothetical protein PENTCL1PPCAC_13770, partial [Pristionchus entomophagus]
VVGCGIRLWKRPSGKIPAQSPTSRVRWTIESLLLLPLQPSSNSCSSNCCRCSIIITSPTLCRSYSSPIFRWLSLFSTAIAICNREYRRKERHQCESNQFLPPSLCTLHLLHPHLLPPPPLLPLLPPSIPSSNRHWASMYPTRTAAPCVELVSDSPPISSPTCETTTEGTNSSGSPMNNLASSHIFLHFHCIDKIKI